MKHIKIWRINAAVEISVQAETEEEACEKADVLIAKINQIPEENGAQIDEAGSITSELLEEYDEEPTEENSEN